MNQFNFNIYSPNSHYFRTMKKTTFIFAFMAMLAATSTMAQSDFNFSFYPAPNYTKMESYNIRDTITNQIVAKADTTSETVNVFVEKVNNKLSVRTLANISRSLYEVNVSFAGFDANGNMVYNAQSKDAETVIVNPMNGTFAVVFQTCVDEPQPGTESKTPTNSSVVVKKYCDTTRHIFGTAFPQQPKPKK